MIRNMKVFDCTLREVGYQTGWYFDEGFLHAIYKYALGKYIDYIELGFFHSEQADANRGCIRYCSSKNEEICKIFKNIKNVTRISAMRDIQRPLVPLVPRKESVIDAIRILTRSHETDFKALGNHIHEIQDLGYETFVNFTSAGYNSLEKNKEFIEFLKNNNVQVIYFADTESVMTLDYVINNIRMCKESGLKVGMHFHNKTGMAEILTDAAIRENVDYIDATHLGLGGKWRDGNLTFDYLLNKIGAVGGFEATQLKNEMIEQIIKYNKYSCAE